MHATQKANIRQCRTIAAKAGSVDAHAFFNLLTGPELFDDVELALPPEPPPPELEPVPPVLLLVTPLAPAPPYGAAPAPPVPLAASPPLPVLPAPPPPAPE